MADSTVYHDAAVQPGTHALVIGVGKYAHLEGGEAPVEKPDGMGQLTSPPISARAFARWLRTDYCNRAKPLASLSLLLSEADPEPFEANDVAEATIDNIEAVVKQWRERADGHPDNRTIFYFCGHGVSQGQDMVLLASDMFADRLNPLNGALDFSSLLTGMRAHCRATQQVFFVDACRASSDTLIEKSGSRFAGKVPLGAGRRPLDWPRCFAIPYYATLEGSLSHARPGAVSLFTEALLRAFKGAGSDNLEGDDDWRVNTNQLYTAITYFMEKPDFAGAVAGKQVPGFGELPRFDLHYLSDPPVVPVYVSCLQAADNATSTFVCRKSGQERLRRDVADVDGENPDAEWPIELPFGKYKFEARVGARPDVWSKKLTVRPPYRDVKLGAGA